MLGNIADITMALPLLEAIRPTRHLIVDKAYDADRLRNWLDGDRSSQSSQDGPHEM